MSLRHLGDARLALITDDVESQYALSDAWDRATKFVLGQAPWRHALKTTTLITDASAVPGYAIGYAYPADWHRTHSIFLVASGRQCPIDLREEGTHILTNSAVAPTIRYVQTGALDPAIVNWPEHFAHTHAAYLAFLVAERVTGDRGAAGKMSQLFSSLLPEAIAIDAIDEDPWLPYQRDGSFQRVARAMPDGAFWRFAMVTGLTGTVAGGAGGFSRQVALPAGWLRTRSLYVLATDRRRPFNIREAGGFWLTDAAAFYAEYLSSTLAMDSTQWPDHYMRAVLHALHADKAAREGTQDQKERIETSRIALADAIDSDAIADDPWLEYQFDGSFQRVAHTMPDEAFWRFAMVTSLAATSAGGAGGFARQFSIPAGWVRTRSLYQLTVDQQPVHAGERRPFDIREAAGLWLTDATGFYYEYLSATLAADTTKWPDHYMRAVLCELHADKAKRAGGQDQKEREEASKIALADAIDSDAMGDDPWRGYQLDGSFVRAGRAVMARGYWWWALKTLDIDPASQETAAAQAGFQYRYALPADWFRTHCLFVPWDGRECPINIRQTAQDWSTDTAGAFTARYLSTDVLDPLTWPEMVCDAVLAYLDAEKDFLDEPRQPPKEQQGQPGTFQRLLADALATYSAHEDPWLRFQLDGTYTQAAKQIAESGRWRFAVKTVSIENSDNPNAFSDGSTSPGYSYRLPKPLDWMRTLRFYYSYANGIGAQWIDIDYRDELGALHANYSPAQLRYVSRLALDSTQWPQNFRDAVLAWLEYQEARADPKMAGVAAAKLEFYNKQCSSALALDDESDVPRVLKGGRFVAARYRRGRIDLKNDWPPI